MSIKPVVTQIVTGAVCPLTLAVTGWWLSAGLRISGLVPVPEFIIAACAIAGFALGLILDIFFLKKWVLRFYNADIRFIIILFLFWSLVIFAFCMGIPIGNFILGVFAGIYSGARLAHSDSSNESVPGIRKVSAFIASVTGMAALGAAFLIFIDPWTRSDVAHLFGLLKNAVPLPWIVLIAIVASGVLTFLQYISSKTAGIFAFKHAAENLVNTDV